MAISKVVYAGTTLVDLTADTVTAERLMVGCTAHTPDGEQVTGTLFSGYPEMIILPMSDTLKDSSGNIINDSAGRPIEDIKRYKRL